MQTYLPCTDLWVVTTYYNPAGYHTRRANYDRFAQPLYDAGIPLVTVECAFGAEPFSLTPAPQLIQVRGRDCMWMKERLINLAIASLPPQATKVAWIDADVLFTNPAWAQQAAALLDRWPLVQLFESISSLQRDQTASTGGGDPSFAYRQGLRRPLSLRTPPGRTYYRFGAYGFGWAARRELLQHGLYDRAILGGGDQLVARASSGEIALPGVLDTVGVERRHWPAHVGKLLRWLADRRRPQWWLAWQMAAMQRRWQDAAPSVRFQDDYQRWAAQWYDQVRGEIGVVPGRILHLWHGELANRRYSARSAILVRHQFTPALDLRLNADGVWEWASDKPLLHREIVEYFQARQEDGD
ncbi:MAG: hypothetical protein ACOYNY_08135 [Caldilineaceae bacterium]